MSKIDATQAVDQADLEPTHTEAPKYTASFVNEGGEPIVQEPVKEEVTDEVQEQTADTAEPNNSNEDGVVELIEDAHTNEEQEEVLPQGEAEVEDVIEVDTDTDADETPIIKEKAVETADALPEWIQNLVDFHNETGGGFEEYQNYTKDFDSLNDTQLLKEYYKNTKPHYSADDIDLLIDNNFGIEEYQEGEEMSREDKLKVLSMKDEISKAKSFLNEQKDKYYTDLKSGVLGAPDQYKDAVDFYSNHKKTVEAQAQSRDSFVKQSEKLLSEDFKGFTYESNGQKFRVKANAQAVRENQMDLNIITGAYLDENGNVTDVQGWHKAVWAAQNADKLFHAGVKAGEALALKERTKATKNPSYTNEGPSKTPKPKYKATFIPPKTNNY